MGIAQYDTILNNTCQNVSILHMLISFHEDLDGHWQKLAAKQIEFLLDRSDHD